MSSIYQISDKVRNIYEELADGIGINQETGEIEPEIMRELAFTKAELRTKVADYGYVIKSIQDDISNYDNEIKRLQTRKKHLENIEKKLKDIITCAMVEFDESKINGPTIQLSLRNSQAVEVEDIDILPLEYKRTKIIVEIDKVAIRKAIQEGIDVAGASLKTNVNLQIK